MYNFSAKKRKKALVKIYSLHSIGPDCWTGQLQRILGSSSSSPQQPKPDINSGM